MNYSGWELGFFDKSKNFRYYQFSLIKKFLKDKILEIGPGNGVLAETYLRKYYSNISLSELDPKLNRKLVRKFKNSKNVKIYKKKIRNFKGKFNSIIYSDVIEHIQDDIKEVESAYSKLKKNGHLIIMVPAFQYLYSDYDKSIGHFRRYQKKRFKDLAKKNKWKIEKMIYFDSIGFLFGLMSKILNSRNQNNVKFGALIWNFLIPLSKILDILLNNSVGKSLLCVYKK